MVLYQVRARQSPRSFCHIPGEYHPISTTFDDVEVVIDDDFWSQSEMYLSKRNAANTLSATVFTSARAP